MADKAEKKIYTKNDIAMALADKIDITKSEAVLHVNEVFEILAEIIQKSNIGDDIKRNVWRICFSICTGSGKKESLKFCGIFKRGGSDRKYRRY